MKYCVANWKMNMNHIQADEYLDVFAELHDKETAENVEIIICPPYTLLDFIYNHKKLNFKLGIQNFHPQNKGAYTGEISLDMMRAGAPIGWAIIGHSERRALFNESN